MSMLQAVPATLERDFAFDDADFSRIRKLIYERAGINLNPSKQNMVYSRLARRLRDTGMTSFRHYLDALEAGTGAEWQEFINALTTNLTAFFREEHHFPLLAERLKALAGRRDIRIWSCASSTGEEPYSLMMTAIETLGSAQNVQLVASDIDTKVLETARRGVYGIDGARGLSPERLRRFFQKGAGDNAGFMRVRPELARAIEFKQLNLLDANWQFNQPFQVVFCRNVMIYFDKPTQRRILEKIHRVLEPGGLLFVGHSENFVDSRDLFTLRGKTVYERNAG
jgi:chemotaxis protein methyltransferase CheR